MEKGMRQPVEDIVLNTAHGLVACVVHHSQTEPAPVIVCAHGLLSSKESCKYIIIGEEFSQAGFTVLRFDFSGCGKSPASLEKKLLRARLHNLQSVLEFVSQQRWCKGSVGLLGSSLGGYLGLLATSGDQALVRAIACWATPFDLGRIDKAFRESEEFRALFPEGVELGDPQSLEDAVLGKGVLVIHGEQDETVPWNDGVEIYRRAMEPKRLCLMKDGDHRFIDPEHRRLARSLSLDWFREHCS